MNEKNKQPNLAPEPDEHSIDDASVEIFVLESDKARYEEELTEAVRQFKAGEIEPQAYNLAKENLSGIIGNLETKIAKAYERRDNGGELLSTRQKLARFVTDKLFGGHDATDK